MKEYILYNSDGKIIKTGICTEASYAIIPSEGEFIMEISAKSISEYTKMLKLLKYDFES